MKLFKRLLLLILPLCMALGCKKDNQFTDTSFVSGAASASNLSVMFNITHDNTGLVTITPNGSAAVTYDVYFGDATANPSSIASGKSIDHTYAEGNYQVKIVAHDIKGGVATITQPLVVSFAAPQNMAVSLSKTNLTVSLSATAKYATFFKVYYGDSTTFKPVPFTSVLPGTTINHTYLNAGTYVITVIALSGGSKTTQILDTVKVGKQISLPVTFDDASVDYTTVDFGGNVSSLSVDPVNSSNHVMKAIKTAGAQTYAGTTLGNGFALPVPLTPNSLKMTVMVYSPAAGLDVKLKLDNHTNPNTGLSVETDVKTTLSRQWETLTFDFSKQATGTPAYSSANTYDLASIFFDFGNNGTGSTFYFDNLMMMPVALTQINLPVSFESTTTDYTMTDFGGNVSSFATDPANSSNHVMKAVKTTGAQVWAGTTVGTATGFSQVIPLTASSLKMTVMVYSPAAGLDVKLKVEDHNDGTKSVETDVKTTLANQWETLTFDLSQPASGTSAWSAANKYDKASLFFDFGNAGTGSTFYFDNLKMAAAGLAQVSVPVTFDDPTVDYTVTDFGGNSSALVVDPANSSNHVIKTIKTSGAQTWAGTTVGNGLGFSSLLPFSAGHTSMSVKVYSPAAGLHIRLKVEDHTDNTKSVETEALTTVAGQWETLTFNFSNQANGTATLNMGYHYDMASIFFDFNNSGTGAVFYWDNMMFL
ncbi:hypothetical protein BDD43_4806 [Mucilaginibacter gracilis]|uniref:PKD/Chitinase domain-containing protein n=1 Tax=Mucilaginibacter gracilis TaxID=423350 RepID=A0A495J742_9SPHI|nr:hypothetical protein [Mucilaginibacter gracilis]RKR84563.1 hypothetical protein BDD43_4806 [Mucilaginibacter gracilis]